MKDNLNESFLKVSRECQNDIRQGSVAFFGGCQFGSRLCLADVSAETFAYFH